MYCEPVKSLLPWQPREQNLSLLALGDTPQAQSCSTTLPPDKMAICQSFTTWANYITAAGGTVQASSVAVYDVLTKQGKSTLALELWSAFGALYIPLQGVNAEFLAAITDINAGKPFEPIEVPQQLPSWPSQPPDGSNVTLIINGVWEALNTVLLAALSKLPAGSNWKVVLSGLISNGQAALNELEPLLEKAFGKSTTAPVS